MSIYFLLFGLLILFLIIWVLFKIFNNSSKSNSKSYIDSAQNIEVNSNATEPESPIDSVEHAIKMQNSFLNPNYGLGTLKKGVVLDDQTYEY